ncbi:hypothetical protein SAMN06295970_1454 [Noviherbaspirillum suwonense]|uniref:Uncharacterized protein n=1 Tax=Noviherbaspirillum suwonense TaxID=1224511 RepID=A0ABY1QUU0_9BURK|nr:hypothetical protein SAMN06295970_1454 [Noviherbaspirillum suwonense]
MNKQNKLIPTEATDNCIVFNTEPPQPSGSGMKQIVTCLVTKTFIYPAEFVQINKHDRTLRYTVRDHVVQGRLKMDATR